MTMFCLVCLPAWSLLLETVPPYVSLALLELTIYTKLESKLERELPASASPLLGLKLCATAPNHCRFC